MLGASTDARMGSGVETGDLGVVSWVRLRLVDGDDGVAL